MTGGTQRAVSTTLGAVAIVVFVAGAWVRRWTCDDAFINFRIVRQIQAGEGPVFNVGDRVESATSTLWLAILTLVDTLAPLRIELIAVVLGIVFSAGGLWFAMAGSSALWRRHTRVGALVVPTGALVWVAVPAARDYATSGLESGLAIGWIGLSWWWVIRSADLAPRRWPLAVVGLGVLVRPDLALVSLGLATAWLLQAKVRRREFVSALAVFAAPAVIVQIARMAYYGQIVPNTAIAKEASMTNWRQGWWYVTDLVGSYWLWLPVVVLFAAAVVVVRTSIRTRTATRAVLVVVLPVVVSGLLNAVYVVRVGGDYMHARMLLPALFTVLLPVAVIPWRRVTVIAGAVVGVWIIAAVTTLGPTYTRVSDTASIDVTTVFDWSTGISDERLTHIGLSGNRNPVTLVDHGGNVWHLGATVVRDYAEQGGRGLVLDGESLGSLDAIVPLDPSIDDQVVVFVGAVGLYGYTVGTDVRVIDRFGLAEPLVAHHRLERRGRPGHEKNLPLEWMVARYAAAWATPTWADRDRLTMARQALACAPMVDLLDASSGDGGWGRLVGNLVDAPRSTTFRFPAEPAAAVADLC